MTPTTRTRTVPRRLDLALDDYASESDVDHVVEAAQDFYSLEEMLAIMEDEASAS